MKFKKILEISAVLVPVLGFLIMQYTQFIQLQDRVAELEEHAIRNSNFVEAVSNRLQEHEVLDAERDASHVER